MKSDKELIEIINETGEDPRGFENLSKEERTRLFLLISNYDLRKEIQLKIESDNDILKT